MKDQSFVNDVNRLKKFNDKIQQLFQERQIAKEARDATTDKVELHKKRAEADAVFGKLEAFYLRVMSLVPQEKKDELQEMFNQAYKASVSESFYNMMLVNIQKDKRLKTPEMKEHFMLYKCFASLVENGLYTNFLNTAAKEIDSEKLDKVIDEIDNFVSPITNNIPVYYYKDKIEEIKEANKQKITDPTLLAELNEELDKVAGAVITSPIEYAENQDKLDPILDSIKNARDNADLSRAFEKEEYSRLNDYFEEDKTNTHNCIKHVKPSQQGNPELYKELSNKNVKIEIPSEIKSALKNIIGFMKQANMVKAYSNNVENGVKVYGFQQIAEAMIEINNAINTTDVQRIKNARLAYEQSLENMREVFKMVKEQIAPTIDMGVGNINCYRVPWLPGEFKNDIVVNSLASAICNLAVTLEGGAVTLDELLEDPTSSFVKIMEANAKNQTPNNLFKDKSIARNMMDMLSGGVATDYPVRAVGRNLELISQLSINSPNRERNVVATFLLQSYDIYIGANVSSTNLSSPEQYATKNQYHTLANIFLVNDSDRDYDKLRAFESYTINGEKKIPQFDTIDYLQNHKIDPSVLLSRIKDAVTEAMTEQATTEEEIESKTVNIAKIIRSGQMAVYKYSMVNATPDASYDKNAYDKLKEILDNPNSAFEYAFLDEGIKKAFDNIKPIQEYIASTQKKGAENINELRKQARLAEKAYNKDADKLTATIQKLTTKINKGKDVEKNQEELNLAKAQLEQLKNNEIKRLERAYCNGELTKDYFENRRFNVERGEHSKTLFFGASEYPSLSKFKKLHKDEFEGVSAEEIEFLYQRNLENARAEENKLMLIISKIQPKPTLKADSEEPAVNQLNQAEREQIVVKEVNGEEVKKADQIVKNDNLDKEIIKNP